MQHKFVLACKRPNIWPEIRSINILLCTDHKDIPTSVYNVRLIFVPLSTANFSETKLFFFSLVAYERCICTFKSHENVEYEDYKASLEGC